MIVPTSNRSNTNRTSSIEDVKKQEKPMHDLVIRGATLVDGLGHDPIRADVAVKDGRIAAIGEVGEDASEMVDAGGLTLMPGIIDLHTHYDAQVTWDPTLSPSPSLGVTTAIMGNCGFGIVPSPPDLRDLIMRNLAVVVGLDLDALRAGIDWRFQSFVDYIGTGPFPLLVFFHGSGFVLCSLDTHDGMCRNPCAGAECVVASVDYRLAPEHKFPAGIEDCLHATRWAAAHAAELGADPMRIAV